MFNIETQNHVKLETLLGQSIEKAKTVLETDFIHYDDVSFANLYFLKFDDLRKFHKITYRSISIELDDFQKIKSITVHFTKYVNNDFYSSFISKYKKPSKILVVDSRKLISEDKTGYQHLSQSELKMREGTLDEKPLFIFWYNEEYQIKILNRNGTFEGSDLTFELATEQKH